MPLRSPHGKGFASQVGAGEGSRDELRRAAEVAPFIHGHDTDFAVQTVVLREAPVRVGVETVVDNDGAGAAGIDSGAVDPHPAATVVESVLQVGGGCVRLCLADIVR